MLHTLVTFVRKVGKSDDIFLHEVIEPCILLSSDSDLLRHHMGEYNKRTVLYSLRTPKDSDEVYRVTLWRLVPDDALRGKQ